MRFIICLFFYLLVGCTQTVTFTEISWRAGDPVADLKSLSTISQAPVHTLKVVDETQELSRQTHYGFPVAQTFVKKIATVDGQWLSVKAKYQSDLPALSGAVQEHFKKPDLAKAKLLKIHSKKIEEFVDFEALWNERGRLVWQGVYFNRWGIPHEIQFDHHFKLVSHRTVAAHGFDRTATLYRLGPKLSDLEEVPIRNLKIQDDLSNGFVRITSKQPLVFDLNQLQFNFNPEDHHFDSLQVFYYVDQVKAWCESVLGFSLQIPLNIQLQTGYPEKTNAAFYYAGNIRLGTGDGTTYSHIPQDVSIVTHEVFHSLIDTLAKLPHEGEGGSLNEAYADFFTSQIIARPYLAESAFLTAAYKRNLQELKTWNQKVGALYGDSLIVSGLLWELSEKISRHKIQQIAVKTLSRLNPSSQFVDFNKELQNILKNSLTHEEMETAQKILNEREFPNVE